MSTTVYPMGTTIYNPEKCWNGYTIYEVNTDGALLIDMNGREVHFWKDVDGQPNKMLPGGSILTNIPGKNDTMLGRTTVAQVDWNGNIEWSFDRAVEHMNAKGESYWASGQHHDIQREGNPVGYYVPGMEFREKGNTLVLGNRPVLCDKVSRKRLNDDYMYEVTWDGEIVWDWNPYEHIDEMGFDEASRKAIYKEGGDWLHINSMSWLGPNRWYDAGDERFKPQNIIVDSRGANLSFIIDRDTGKIVWRLGPDYSQEPFKKLGWIIGQHHVHMIPRGLPGEGNILIFDNGSNAGYGAPTPWNPRGVQMIDREYSRVIEIDPTTYEIVWQYPERPSMEAGYFLYSPNVSLAQRLPNGNTLICEGLNGRFIEVTADHEIVWEYLAPHVDLHHMSPQKVLYRCYRVPYDWAPLDGTPEEVPVVRPDNSTFRLPGAAASGGAEEVCLKKDGIPVEVPKIEKSALGFGGPGMDFSGDGPAPGMQSPSGGMLLPGCGPVPGGR